MAVFDNDEKDGFMVTVVFHDRSTSFSKWFGSDHVLKYNFLILTRSVAIFNSVNPEKAKGNFSNRD